MKRRIFGLFMALVMMLSLVPTVVFASETVASGTCGAEGDNLTWTLDDAGTLTISGTGKMEDYTHPYIEDPIIPQWYDYRSDITQIVVEDGVTSIGVYAFYSIWNLRDISLPNSLTEIGAHAFGGCYCISEITIPDSVTSIGECAFAFCNSLDSVAIPESVAFIGNRAFGSCSYLTQIVVSDANPNFCNDDNGVLFTKDKTMLLQCPDAFSGAYTIPDSVTAIDDRAFYGCNGLTAITIPGSVESIGSYLFADCNSLTNVTICNGVTSIGSSAFSYCSALTDVTIPNSVTYIGDNAFGGCTSLASLEIPNSVTSIGDRAFWNCNSLTNVEIPDSVTSIGSGAFKNCNSLAEISISEAMLANINVADVFGGTLWYINNYGVSGSCGDDLTWNLDGNGVLTVTGSGAMDDYMVRFDADEEILPPWWNYKNAITQVVIEDGVTYIGEGAFGYEYEEDDSASYPNLTTVSFPDSLTEIGAYAFTYCQALTDIVLPTHLEKINGSAFLGCGGLRDVTIPASVTDLAIGAFSSCNNMTAINIAEDNEVYSSIDGVVFNKAETELIRCPAGYSGEYIIPNGVTSIGNRVFYFCRNLTSVTIPDSVTSIGDAAFYYCASMSTVTIGNGVERIERSAFQSCDGMTSVVIPENVTYIGEYAFAYCENLSSVSYSENTEVAETAFEGTPWYRGNPGGGDDPAPEEFTTSGIVYVGENTIDIPDGGMVYYAFTPEESGQYRFTSGEVEDTYAQLLDENCIVIAEDDDSGDALNFLISYDLEAGKTYYIGVKYLNGQAGTITVHIERHEHEFVYYGRVWRWDNEKCEDVDVGHAAYCELCGERISDIEPHDYDGNYCTVCGAADPTHEHVFGWYSAVYEWDEENCEDIDVGHVAHCDICGCWMGDVEPHDYQDNRCTVCGAADPAHEHVFDHWSAMWDYDEDTGVEIGLGHIAYCSICEHMYGNVEPHDYDGNYCTVCGAANPDHECVPEYGWSYGEGYGHYKLCTICRRLVGNEYDHTYENGRCTVCGAIDPNHEHVFGYYGRAWRWDEEACRDVEVGHAAYCKLCDRIMGDIEPHVYDDDYCIACDAVNPDHEHVAGGWEQYLEWDEINGENVDLGHYVYCDICYQKISDIEPHNFQDNYCTVCGAIDPNHEHVAGRGRPDWSEDVENGGHYPVCAVCSRQIGDEIIPHTFEHGRCTACGVINPGEHVHDYTYSVFEESHTKVCRICGSQKGAEAHTYDANGVCTACGWMQGAEDILDISIRIGENKELIITLTCANGNSADMTVEKAYMPFGNHLAGNWTTRGVWVYTDKGAVRLYFAKDDEGRFCVFNTTNRKGRVQSNILDKCEWYDVYSTLWDENLVDPRCIFDGNVWVVDGKAHDGEPVHMTLDGDGNILTCEIGISSGDIDATLPGDVNNDGRVNQKDVARLRQYIGASAAYPLDAVQNADVNCDGKINQKDVARLRQYIGDPEAHPLG